MQADPDWRTLGDEPVTIPLDRRARRLRQAHAITTTADQPAEQVYVLRLAQLVLSLTAHTYRLVVIGAWPLTSRGGGRRRCCSGRS